MSTEIKTKKSFRTLDIARISPQPQPGAVKSMNLMLTFEEALKLHFGLGQALAKLNTYSRSTADGKRACVNVCVFPEISRITINEDKLPKSK